MQDLSAPAALLFCPGPEPLSHQPQVGAGCLLDGWDPSVWGRLLGEWGPSAWGTLQGWPPAGLEASSAWWLHVCAQT